MYERLNGDTATIRRFIWNEKSPLFGRYYIVIQTSFGSMNTSDIPESFETKKDAESFLREMGFKEII